MHWNIATNNSSIKICRNETSNNIFLVPAQWGLALEEFRWANSPDSYGNAGHSWWHCPKNSGPSNPSRFFRPVACFCSPWPGQSQGRFCSPHLLKVKHNQTKVSVWNCYHCTNGEAEHASVFKSHHLSHDPLPVHLTFARVSVAIGLVFLEDPVRIKCHRSWWRDGKAVMVQKCPSIHRVLPVLHTTWQFLALEIVGKEFISLITHGIKGESISVIQYTSTPYTVYKCTLPFNAFQVCHCWHVRQFAPPRRISSLGLSMKTSVSMPLPKRPSSFLLSIPFLQPNDGSEMVQIFSDNDTKLGFIPHLTNYIPP